MAQTAPLQVPAAVKATTPSKPSPPVDSEGSKPTREAKPPNQPAQPIPYIGPVYQPWQRPQQPPPPPIYPYPVQCHTCAQCKRPRSRRYHRDHPIIPGRTYRPEVCRRCQGSKSSSDSDREARRRLARLEKDTIHVTVRDFNDERGRRPRFTEEGPPRSQSTSHAEIQIRFNDHEDETRPPHRERGRHRVESHERIPCLPPPRPHSLDPSYSQSRQDAERRIASHPQAYRHGRMQSLDRGHEFQSPDYPRHDPVYAVQRRAGPSSDALVIKEGPKQRITIEDGPRRLHSLYSTDPPSRRHSPGPSGHPWQYSRPSILRSVSRTRNASSPSRRREMRRSDESHMADVGGPRVTFAADSPQYRGRSRRTYDGHDSGERWDDCRQFSHHLVATGTVAAIADIVNRSRTE